MGDSQRHVISEDSDDDDENVYIYPINMHLDEQDAYRAVFHT